MIAGPNGSGKSELFKNLALERSPTGVFHGGPFVNADELEEQWRTVGAIAIALMAGEIASLLISRMAVPVLSFMANNTATVTRDRTRSEP